jgi:hypothetical protein
MVCDCTNNILLTYHSRTVPVPARRAQELHMHDYNDPGPSTATSMADDLALGHDKHMCSNSRLGPYHSLSLTINTLLLMWHS